MSRTEFITDLITLLSCLAIIAYPQLLIYIVLLNSWYLNELNQACERRYKNFKE